MGVVDGECITIGSVRSNIAGRWMICQPFLPDNDHFQSDIFSYAGSILLRIMKRADLVQFHANMRITQFLTYKRKENSYKIKKRTFIIFSTK